jgi:hypothetical protein
MGGLCRFRARGILFLGAVIVLVPFVHVGSSPDRTSSLAVHRPTPATISAEAPDARPVRKHAAPLPDQAMLRLVATD